MAPRKPKIDTPPTPETKESEAKEPEAKAPEAKAPEAKAPEAKAPEVKKVKVGKFAGKVYAFYHPFQRVPIPAGGDGVTLELDSWLKAQIDAGHIVKL